MDIYRKQKFRAVANIVVNLQIIYNVPSVRNCALYAIVQQLRELGVFPVLSVVEIIMAKYHKIIGEHKECENIGTLT